MKIHTDSTVELEYSIKDAEGELREETEDGPEPFQLGQEELPQLLEQALVGKEAGDELTVELQPADAFGEFDAGGIVSVPRSDFPEDFEPELGEQVMVHFEGEDGVEEELETHVMEVNPDAIVLDANHPLAGQVVTFWVRVGAVRS